MIVCDIYDIFPV